MYKSVQERYPNYENTTRNPSLGLCFNRNCLSNIWLSSRLCTFYLSCILFFFRVHLKTLYIFSNFSSFNFVGSKIIVAIEIHIFLLQFAHLHGFSWFYWKCLWYMFIYTKFVPNLWFCLLISYNYYAALVLIRCVRIVDLLMGVHKP